MKAEFPREIEELARMIVEDRLRPRFTYGLPTHYDNSRFVSEVARITTTAPMPAVTPRSAGRDLEQQMWRVFFDMGFSYPCTEHRMPPATMPMVRSGARPWWPYMDAQFGDPFPTNKQPLGDAGPEPKDQP